MNKSLKVSIGILAIASVLFLASFYNLSVTQQYAASSSIGESSGLTGHVTVYVNGEFWCEVPNNVVDIGEKRIRNFLGWMNNTSLDTGNITKFIALSPDSAPADTATELANEYTDYGLTRAAGTVSYENATSYSVEHEFTCTADTKLVTSSAIHWNASSNSMYACADLSNPPTLDTDDTCTITWTLQTKTG